MAVWRVDRLLPCVSVSVLVVVVSVDGQTSRECYNRQSRWTQALLTNVS